MGRLLKNLAQMWLRIMRSNGAEAMEQERTKAAEGCIGVLYGGKRDRTEQARSTIRARLAARHAYQTSD
jgi:hypothetical protein